MSCVEFIGWPTVNIYRKQSITQRRFFTSIINVFIKFYYKSLKIMYTQIYSPNLFQSQSFQFWKENIFCVIWFMFWQWFCIVWTAPWKYLSDYHLIQPATASRCRWTRRTWWTSWEACRRASGSTTIGGGSKTGKDAIFSSKVDSVATANFEIVDLTPSAASLPLCDIFCWTGGH